MTQWTYDVTVYPLETIVAQSSGAMPDERVLFCQDDGACFFDNLPNPYVHAIVELFDERGREGWILVQTVLREQDMICFWRRPVQEAEA